MYVFASGSHLGWLDFKVPLLTVGASGPVHTSAESEPVLKYKNLCFICTIREHFRTPNENKLHYIQLTYQSEKPMTFTLDLYSETKSIYKVRII